MDTAELVRKCLCDVLGDEDLAPDNVDLDRKLFDGYGLTSLNMVLLMTSLCEEADIPLTAFTEKDIAGLKTSRDIVDALDRAMARRQQHVVG